MYNVHESSDHATCSQFESALWGFFSFFSTIVLGSDHPFQDSASYVTETAGTNQPSHSLVTQFTAKCDIGLSEISSDEN